jgi:hypothetical protein
MPIVIFLWHKVLALTVVLLAGGGFRGDEDLAREML